MSVENGLELPMVTGGGGKRRSDGETKGGRRREWAAGGAEKRIGTLVVYLNILSSCTFAGYELDSPAEWKSGVSWHGDCYEIKATTNGASGGPQVGGCRRDVHGVAGGGGRGDRNDRS